MTDKPVQEIHDRLGLEESIVYRIPGLKQGDTLYVHVKGTSGNFDPLVALVAASEDIESLRRLSLDNLEQDLPSPDDPVAAVANILDNHALAWNDDFRGRYHAALEFRVPSDGSYRLLVRSSPIRQTSGKFRLLVGVNAPEVLEGTAEHNTSFVLLDQIRSQAPQSIESDTGTISAAHSFRFHNLEEFNAGETLYVSVSALSGDLAPSVTLFDFGEKPLSTANFSGEQTSAALRHTFARKAGNCRLKISGRRPDGTVGTGEYRIVVGVDAPGVLKGESGRTGRPLFKKPITVKIGIAMQQITYVDQKSENFGVVATLLMEWQDPALAFNPEEIDNIGKVHTGDEFSREMSRRGILWPNFTILNQQGNRWVQNRMVVQFPDGRVIYAERFTTSLQAPDFDFRRFPFDTQQFFIRIESLWPEWFYRFEPLAEYSKAGEQLGEEEWIVTGFDTGTDLSEIAGRPVSRFNFRFHAKRHLEYYIFRIFLPIFIILVVSWVVFFLKDYAKRIDVAGANLLLFIAFNFTISNDLPRLGYLTFMDAILISAFVVTALVLILSVFLRRLAISGREGLAQRIDMYVIRWLYPVAYIAAVSGVTILFG